MNTSMLFILLSSLLSFQDYPDALLILQKVDDNLTSETKMMTSQMIIYGRRNDRIITSTGYSKGDDQSFTTYSSPEREKGKKMLKLADRLWIYSPSTDRIIQLSGHMLKQSLMGSDLSYEDMMDSRKFTNLYHATVVGEEVVDQRNTWVLELTAKVEDVSYAKRKMWVDQQRYVPLREDLFAKSGQLLKRTIMKNIEKIGTRWYPKKINYKDMLKDGKGTDFIILEITINPSVPSYIFTKASLKK